MPSRTEARIEGDEEGLNFGVDVGSFSASISSSGVLSLGVGVAEVELNLKDPNESTVSYAFGLYRIEGDREGCTVVLSYYIADEFTHSETRTVPECDEEEDPEPEPEPEPEPQPDPSFPAPKKPKLPSGSPYDFGYWLFSKERIIMESGPNFGGWETDHESYTHTDVRFDNTIGDFSYTQNIKTYNYSINVSSYPYSNTFVNVVNDVRRNRPINGWGEVSNMSRYDKVRELTVLDNVFAIGGWRWQIEAWLEQLEEPIYINQSTGYYFLAGGQVSSWPIRDQSGGVMMSWPLYLYAKQQLKFHEEFIIKKGLPIHKQPPPYKQSPTMNNRCCQMIAEIHEALNVKELLSKGFIVPNRMVAPGAKGSTKLETYLEIQEWQFRQADLLGIHPFTATIKDSNEAQAGDQSLSIQFPNATAALKFAIESAMENKGDAAVRLSLLVRIAFALTEVISISVKGARAAKALASYLGMPFIDREETVRLPFDVTLGAFKPKPGEGFAKPQTPEQAKQKIIDKLNKNDENTTEDMLPDFMQVGDLKVPTVDCRPDPEFNFWGNLKRTLRID